MRKAFLFADTEVEVIKGGDSRKLQSVVAERTVIVQTPDMTGAAVILGDRIVTSLFLVRNFKMVSVCFRGGKKRQAVVAERNEKVNLAGLRLADISPTTPSDHVSVLMKKLQRSHPLHESKPKAIGDALFVSNTRTGVPKVAVAAMLYGISLCERFENRWRINPGGPPGIIGAGVWDTEGGLTGIALGAVAPLPEVLLESALAGVSSLQPAGSPPLRSSDLPQVYALPVADVLDFVETN